MSLEVIWFYLPFIKAINVEDLVIQMVNGGTFR